MRTATLVLVSAICLFTCGYATGVAIERRRAAAWRSIVSDDTAQQVEAAVFNERIRIVHQQLAEMMAESSLEAMRVRRDVVTSLSRDIDADSK